MAVELAEEAFALTCRVAHSSVVVATRAGWSNLSLLFEAVFAFLPSQQFSADVVLIRLLDIPFPNEAVESRTAAWPDPSRLLVMAWYPKRAAPEAAPHTEVRPLGEKFVAGARTALTADPRLRVGFEEFRRRLRAIEPSCGRERRLIVTRRVELLDQMLSGPNPSTSSTPVHKRRGSPGRTSSRSRGR